MSIKSKVFAAAATMTVVAVAVAAADTLSSAAAAPSGDDDYIDNVGYKLGRRPGSIFQFIAPRQNEKPGPPPIRFQTRDFDPVDDFTAAFDGLVSDLYTAKLTLAAVNPRYGGDSTAFPADPASGPGYKSLGAASGMLMGVTSSAHWTGQLR